MLVKAGLSLTTQLLSLIGSRGEKAKEAIENARDAMDRTWTDEIITLYWFGPTILAMLGYAGALVQQQAAISDYSPLFQVQIAITAAVFGLGKMKIK